jgi:hypothetical protein
MNDWETDSKLYEDVLDPKSRALKENEMLREEMAALKKEVAELKKEKAERKKEIDKEHAKLIKLVIDSDEKGSFYYFTRVYIALYKHHNRGHRVPSIVIDELEQYKDTFLWELISKDLYSDDIAQQCREALNKVLANGMVQLLLDRWMRIAKFLPNNRMGQRYFYADIMSEDGYHETKWLDVFDDKHLLSKGLCFHTKEAAIAFSEKMA